MIRKCEGCKQEKEHHAKGFCYNCYKKRRWIPQIAQKRACKRCQKVKVIHSKELCSSCYSITFHSSKIKEQNYLKSHGITLEKYEKIAKKCIICGFDKIIELYSISKSESSEKNKLIPLCPNHNKMINNSEFRGEMRNLLQEKGIILAKDPKLDFVFDKEDIKSENLDN